MREGRGDGEGGRGCRGGRVDGEEEDVVEGERRQDRDRDRWTHTGTEMRGVKIT